MLWDPVCKGTRKHPGIKLSCFSVGIRGFRTMNNRTANLGMFILTQDLALEHLRYFIVNKKLNHYIEK